MTDQEHDAFSSLHPLPLHTPSLFAPVSADVLWPRSVTAQVSGFLGSGVVQSPEDLYSVASKCSHLYREVEEVCGWGGREVGSLLVYGVLLV